VRFKAENTAIKPLKCEYFAERVGSIFEVLQARKFITVDTCRIWMKMGGFLL